MNMANKITTNLFSNAAFTRAFRVALNDPTQKVIYNGVTWEVGNQKFKLSEGKMHPIRACLLKFGHKIRMLCSYQYCKNYKKCVRKFEKAQIKWPRIVAKRARETNMIMMKHEYLIAQLPLNIEKTKNALSSVEVEIKISCERQRKSSSDSEEVKRLNRKNELLQQLEGSLGVYLTQRIEKESKKVSDQIVRLISEYLPLGDIKKSSFELEGLAKEILDPIPLSSQNVQDSTHFIQEITKNIQENNRLASELINHVDVKKLEDRLRTLKERLQRFQNEQGSAVAITTDMARKYKDTKLLLSPPQSPMKTTYKKKK